MDDYLQQLQNILPEKYSWIGLFNYPVLYFKVRKYSKVAKNRIKKYDTRFVLPKFKIRYTRKQHNIAGIKHDNNKFILLINPKIKDDTALIRAIVHEFMHLWIGPDLNTGYQFRTLPEFCLYCELPRVSLCAQPVASCV